MHSLGASPLDVTIEWLSAAARPGASWLRVRSGLALAALAARERLDDS
jgi:hypothetical protein